MNATYTPGTQAFLGTDCDVPTSAFSWGVNFTTFTQRGSYVYESLGDSLSPSGLAGDVDPPSPRAMWSWVDDPMAPATTVVPAPATHAILAQLKAGGTCLKAGGT